MGGLSLPAGIEPEEWDVFHNLVVVDELNRLVGWFYFSLLLILNSVTSNY